MKDAIILYPFKTSEIVLSTIFLWKRQVIEFVYIHPKSSDDHRRWFGGIVRCQKGATENLHNHPIHASNKIAQCVKEKISAAAATANPTLTPSDIAHGKGVGFIPSAVDKTSTHTGKISEQIRKTKQQKGLSDKDWSPMDFEQTADFVDKEDTVLQSEDDQ